MIVVAVVVVVDVVVAVVLWLGGSSELRSHTAQNSGGSTPSPASTDWASTDADAESSASSMAPSVAMSAGTGAPDGSAQRSQAAMLVVLPRATDTMTRTHIHTESNHATCYSACDRTKTTIKRTT